MSDYLIDLLGIDLILVFITLFSIGLSCYFIYEIKTKGRPEANFAFVAIVFMMTIWLTYMSVKEIILPTLTG